MNAVLFQSYKKQGRKKCSTTFLFDYIMLQIFDNFKMSLFIIFCILILTSNGTQIHTYLQIHYCIFEIVNYQILFNLKIIKCSCTLGEEKE